MSLRITMFEVSELAAKFLYMHILHSPSFRTSSPIFFLLTFVHYCRVCLPTCCSPHIMSDIAMSSTLSIYSTCFPFSSRPFPKCAGFPSKSACILHDHNKFDPAFDSHDFRAHLSELNIILLLKHEKHFYMFNFFIGLIL